jgi:hypothetical protein
MQTRKENLRILVKDPSWDETPEMGPEGMIAAIDDQKELIEALKKNKERTKENLDQKRLYPE